jgi:signal transduction histidine kinase
MSTLTATAKNIINQLVDIPTEDPDDARRRKVVNILVLILTTVVVVMLLVVFILDILGMPLPAPLSDPKFRTQGYVGSIIALVLCAIIYGINRRSGLVAGVIFSLFVGVGLYFNIPDHPVVANATFALTIAVVCTTLFVHSTAGFVMAAVSTIVIAIIGALTGAGFYIAAAGDFFGVALCGWFAARSLERALKDVRILNVELDQRVQDRTQDLAEALAENQAILNSTADGVIVFDNAGLATVTNPAISALIELPAEKIIGQDVKNLLECAEETEDDRCEVIKLISAGGASNTALKFQWGPKTLSTTIAPVQVESSPEGIGTVAVFRDFTREAEIDHMKSTFVSIASHELRTPLNAILGYTELLHEEVYGPLTDRQRDAAGRIMANTNHMLSLANNLLDRAQIEAGTLELNIMAFSPVKVINDAIDATEVLAQNKGLALSSETDGALPTEVIGDWQRVSQIVVNLIGNALKFTKEGGVSVSAYRVDSDYWAIAVSDTGTGIAKEAQSYIFEPFRRADESPTREHRGAGLGLSIVKQLVTIMGGKIELESEIGKGSTFIITLPLALDAADMQPDIPLKVTKASERTDEEIASTPEEASQQ